MLLLRQLSLALPAAAVLSLIACGPSAPTGAPGPLGAAYDATQEISNLNETAAELPGDYRRNYDAIRAALPLDPAQIKKHSRNITLQVKDGQARLRLEWESYAINERVLILKARLAATAYDPGVSCTAGEWQASDVIHEPFFKSVSLEVNCATEGYVMGRTFYFSGSPEVNAPAKADGALHVSSREFVTIEP
jgi:hypothetical protein